MWNKIQQRSWEEVFLAIEALVSLMAFSLAIRLLPFRQIARLCGLSTAGSNTPLAESSGPLEERVGWAVAAAGRRRKPAFSCLAQALTGAMMLKRRGIPAVVYLGVDRSRMPIQAHAWLQCGNRILTGEAGREQFRAVGMYHTM